MKKEKENEIELILGVGIILFVLIFNLFLISATPTAPTNINSTSNETKSPSSSGLMFNISGGYISKMNITAVSQNPHWKAFVGWIDGRFTLDDASGSTIYDWSLTSVGGEVYATRTSGSVTWTSVNCANATQIENENQVLNFNSSDDNVTATFDSGTHDTFLIGKTVTITANNCSALTTYVNNQSQAGTSYFQEVVLNDYANSNIIYATILEEDVTGYDGQTYDFQMLVPDNASATWTGALPYYLYVELD